MFEKQQTGYGEIKFIGRDFIVRMVKKQLGNTYTEAYIYKAIKDIN